MNVEAGHVSLVLSLLGWAVVWGRLAAKIENNSSTCRRLEAEERDGLERRGELRGEIAGIHRSVEAVAQADTDRHHRLRGELTVVEHRATQAHGEMVRGHGEALRDLQADVRALCAVVYGIRGELWGRGIIPRDDPSYPPVPSHPDTQPPPRPRHGG